MLYNRLLSKLIKFQNHITYAGRSIARQFCCFVFIVLFWRRKSLLKRKNRTPFLYQSSFFSSVVELRGLEPLTYALRTHRSTNWAITPQGCVTIKLSRFTQPLLPTDYKTQRFYVSRCRPQKFLPHEAVKILVEVGREQSPTTPLVACATANYKTLRF